MRALVIDDSQVIRTILGTMLREMGFDVQEADEWLRLMMVTTENEMSRVLDALNAGADEYVMKPFTREIIIDKLRLIGMELF